MFGCRYVSLGCIRKGSQHEATLLVGYGEVYIPGQVANYMFCGRSVSFGRYTHRSRPFVDGIYDDIQIHQVNLKCPFRDGLDTLFSLFSLNPLFRVAQGKLVFDTRRIP